MKEKSLSLPSRNSLRLRGYDYRQEGAYFVTICTARMNCLFGHISDDAMLLNELGIIVEDRWRNIADIRANIELDQFVVMPNHLHGILFFLGGGSTDNAAKTLPSNSLGAVVGQFKRAVMLQYKSLSQHQVESIWQRNYYDHIIRNEHSLNEIRKYIANNPTRWRQDSLYVD